MKNENVTRVNFNINNEVLKKVDDFASENGINRTSAFSVIVSTYFRQEDAVKAINKAVNLADIKSAL